MENPYPNNETIQSFLSLYENFLDASHQELVLYQTNIKQAQQKLEVADMALKSFEGHILDRLTDLIRRLPISKCRFCGGDVVDKSALRPFIEHLHPVLYDEKKYWLKYSVVEKMKLCQECQTCGVYWISSEDYIHYSTKNWFRSSLRKPKFIVSLFSKYPFVQAFSETDTPFRWTFAVRNGEYWCMDKTKEEMIAQLGLTTDSKFPEDLTDKSDM